MTALESTGTSPFFVGIDLHQGSLVISVLRGWEPDFYDEVRLPNDLAKVRRYFRKLLSHGPVRCCYEASSSGYVLQRALKELGVECVVIAPSLIPKRRGDRIKTDRRDARKLARLLRTGDLTPIHVPTEGEEAVRELVRLRDTLRQEVHRSRQYVLKLLQRHNSRCPEGTKNWSVAFWSWLKRLELPGPTGEVLGYHLTLLDTKLGQLGSLDRRLEELAQSDGRLRGPVGRLRCLRGIDTLSALVLVTEIVDARRFATARRLMAWVGLAVCEESSGESERRGGITKAGNALCRRILVEAAWHYRHRPATGAGLAKRQEDQDPRVVSYAKRAQQRLHKRFRDLDARKDRCTTVTAVARELVGFVWALLRDEPALLIEQPRR
jgi:transposase